jgi:protein-disulfide isomerase
MTQLRLLVKNVLSLAAMLLLSPLLPGARAQQQPPAVSSQAASPTQAQKNIEAFLRHLFALGPDVQLTVGPLKEIGASGLMETSVDLKSADGQDTVKMFLTKDGKYLLRGELSDMTKDPLAETVAQIQSKSAAVLGDPNAPITLVEFADFECPVCRSLHDALRGMLPNYPQVKVVFKDFPIENLHPWARTAALAGRCAYQQDPRAFWKLYDLFYDNQDVISAENAWSKVNEYASLSGLNPETFKSCMTGPQAAAEVDASVANARQLDVRSTPTIFVNGRRLVGADPHILQQYIDYELAQWKAGKSAQKKK